MNTVNPIFICNYFNSRFTWDWKNNSLLRVLESGIPPRGQDAWFRTKRISHCCLTLVKPISHRCSMIMRDKQFKYFYQVYSFSYKEHAIFILATNFRNFHRTRTRLRLKIFTTTWMSRTSQKNFTRTNVGLQQMLSNYLSLLSSLKRIYITVQNKYKKI